jgi:glucan phosphoethanolaminetransferase (alkaline phosphatase superfamily)
MRGTSLGGFVVRVAAWLPLAFLVWYLAGPLFVFPIGLLTGGVARLGFADIVQSVEQHGYVISIVSTLKAALATTENPGGGVVSVDLNALLYSFGFPMLVALILAARQPHVLRKIVLGYVVLAPFVTWGLIAEFLKRVTFDIAPSAAAQAGFGPLQREAIAFAYQFGALILPTVAPAVFWVLTHRRFLENFAAGEAPAEKRSR